MSRPSGTPSATGRIHTTFSPHKVRSLARNTAAPLNRAPRVAQQLKSVDYQDHRSYPYEWEHKGATHECHGSANKERPDPKQEQRVAATTRTRHEVANGDSDESKCHKNYSRAYSPGHGRESAAVDKFRR